MKAKLLVTGLTFMLSFSLNAQYISSTVDQVSVPCLAKASTNNTIIRVLIDIGTTPVPINQLIFNHNGSTNPLFDIGFAKVYYTTDTIFSSIQQFGNTWTVFPTATMAFVSSMQLASGKNYFWLTFSIPAVAVCNDYVDAECINLLVNSISYVPTVTSPPGAAVICCATGISLNFQSPILNFQISPNPATDKINISFPASTSENTTLKIYSITGENLFQSSETLEKLNTAIDVTGLSNGIYFLSVQTGKEKITRKIAVTH